MSPSGEQKKARRREEGEAAAEAEAPPKAGTKDRDDLDQLVDEIDEILEENAEEFVRSYVQKGGE